MAERVTINGRQYETKQILGIWDKRRKEAEDSRKEFLPQVRVNRKFVAGKQHLEVNTRDGRVLELPKHYKGVELVKSNILDQYLLTAIGRLSSADYRPNFITEVSDELSADVARQMNLAFGWGWQHEWRGDEKTLALWLYLAVDGTCAVRCRYDRSLGEIVGDEVPYVNGVPILDEDKRRQYVADKAADGEIVDFGILREGQVVWELFSMENLLPPPGIEAARNFPWEIIVRPVSVDDVKYRYKKLADEVVAEDIEDTTQLTAGLGLTESKPVKLEDRVFVYTGYERPSDLHPKGRTVVWTKDNLLDVREQLPYADHPSGPRSGLHYFRWQTIPGRFWGKAFIENGIDSQKILNKRLTQINAIIDRGMPKIFMEESSLARPRTGEPLEIIEVRPGSPLPNVAEGVQPGAWMLQDVKLQVENAERALGIRGVTMGQAPQGVSAYSAMALLTENDSLKLDPVAQDFRLVMNELCWDTMEAMRNWPSQKQILISGPEGQLRAFLFNSNVIPYHYIASPPRGGSLPRSQAAEIQKINDMWQASGGRLPFTWYYDSIQAGKAQDLPPSLGDQDAHKAELENIVMTSALEPAPVAPYDDDNRHVEIHRSFQVPLTAIADMGDPEAQQKVQVLEQHIQMHLQAAQSQQAPLTPEQGIPTQPPQGMEGMGAAPVNQGVPELPGLPPIQ